jgi:hypothetical protein
MASYLIVPRDDGSSGYEIRVVSDTGGRHTMLGFATEADAEIWISEDRRLNKDSGEAIPTGNGSAPPG